MKNLEKVLSKRMQAAQRIMRSHKWVFMSDIPDLLVWLHNKSESDIMARLKKIQGRQLTRKAIVEESFPQQKQKIRLKAGTLVLR
jgi:hypothetical protein